MQDPGCLCMADLESPIHLLRDAGNKHFSGDAAGVYGGHGSKTQSERRNMVFSYPMRLDTFSNLSIVACSRSMPAACAIKSR